MNVEIESNITPAYDPRKRYKWEKDSNFCFSGEEFGMILNSLRAILNSPESRVIMAVEKASMIAENSLSRAVELGIAQEEIEMTKSPSSK